MLSCAKQHYTNQGIRENGTLFVNLVNEAILSQADYVCSVADYDTEGFDNFILKIINTYAEETILNERGKVDFQKLSPVLFDMPNYEYLRTGTVIGSCLKLDKEVQ